MISKAHVQESSIPRGAWKGWYGSAGDRWREMDVGILLDEVALSRGRVGGELTAELLETVSRHGFAVWKSGRPAAVRKHVAAVGRELGRVVGHDRSGSDGLILISSMAEDSIYIGQLPKAHLPHTDGCFLERPPEVMILGCESAASSGGESVLLSAKGIYHALQRDAPWALPLLTQPSCLSFVRGERAAEHAVFSRRGSTSSRLGVVFRSDGVAQASSQPVELAYQAMRELVLSPELQIRFRLEPGDLLIVDNTAMLHGRTAFEDGSQKRRLWRGNFIGDRIPSHLLGFDPSR